MKFGTEKLHLELRKAFDSGDRDYAGELLYEPVRRTARYLFAKHSDHFSMYSDRDREDAVQNAYVYMLDHLQDLAYPKEEGTPSSLYYANFVLSGMRKERYKIIRDSKTDPLDAPVTGGDGDDGERTRQDFIPSKAPQPDRIALARDNLHNALRDFFQLKNDPATLISVAYVITNEALGFRSMSLNEYADYFNGRKVAEVLLEFQDILNTLHLDTGILAPVRQKLRAKPEPPRFANVTAGKLASRKNSILSILRNRKDPED